MFKQITAYMLLCFCALGVHADVVNVDSAELVRLAATGVAVIDIRTKKWSRKFEQFFGWKLWA